MKKRYRSKYHYTQAELKSVSDKALLVFDTNALLDILRLTPDLAKKVLKVIEDNLERVRIPEHVIWEYHRHIIDIPAEMYAKTNDAYKKFDKEIFQAPLDVFYNQHKKIRIETREKINNIFEKAYNQTLKELKLLTDYFRDNFQNQTTQLQIGDLLSDKILPGFSADKKKDIEEEGAKRYAEKIPPGYEDAKTKDDNQYGDLIIWYEILELAKEDNDIFFISNDLKEDWILTSNGLKCGPRTELLDEFNAISTKIFHIYSLTQFLELFAKKKFNETELRSVEDLFDSQPILGSLKIDPRYPIHYGYQNYMAGETLDQVIESIKKISCSADTSVIEKNKIKSSEATSSDNNGASAQQPDNPDIDESSEE